MTIADQPTRGNHGRVVQISDLHLAADRDDGPQSPDVALDATVDAIAGGVVDLVLLTGDVADDGSPAAYRRVASIVERIGAPVLATAGNHDLPDELRNQFGATTRATLGGWRVVTIDTTIPGELHGRIDIGQLLAELGPDGAVPTVLAMHHPPISTSNHPWFQLHGGADLVAFLAARRDVRVVLTGHLHEAFHAVSGGVTYIGCSSSWYSLRHRADEYIRDDGHVGGLAIDLYDDGAFEWRRIARA